MSALTIVLLVALALALVLLIRGQPAARRAAAALATLTEQARLQTDRREAMIDSLADAVESHLDLDLIMNGAP